MYECPESANYNDEINFPFAKVLAIVTNSPESSNLQNLRLIKILNTIQYLYLIIIRYQHACRANMTIIIILYTSLIIRPHIIIYCNILYNIHYNH